MSPSPVRVTYPTIKDTLIVNPFAVEKKPKGKKKKKGKKWLNLELLL